MFTLAKLAVFLAAALSVAAMPSHQARQGHHHREIAARVALPEVAPVAEIDARGLPAKRLLRKKRARTGRCPSSVLPSSSLPQNPQPTPSLHGDVKENPEPSSTSSQDPPATPNVDPAPPTSTPVQPDPTTPSQPNPTPDQANSPTPTPTPTPTSNSGNGNGDGTVYTGQGTFYATGLGACGITNNDGQNIAAVAHSFFDSFPGYDGVNPNNNPMCGKTARVTFQGKTVDVSLTDRCEGCQWGDLDFSPTAFNQLADPSAGRISGIQWQIIN